MSGSFKDVVVVICLTLYLLVQIELAQAARKTTYQNENGDYIHILNNGNNKTQIFGGRNHGAKYEEKIWPKMAIPGLLGLEGIHDQFVMQMSSEEKVEDKQGLGVGSYQVPFPMVGKWWTVRTQPLEPKPAQNYRMSSQEKEMYRADTNLKVNSSLDDIWQPRLIISSVLELSVSKKREWYQQSQCPLSEIPLYSGSVLGCRECSGGGFGFYKLYEDMSKGHSESMCMPKWMWKVEKQPKRLIEWEMEENENPAVSSGNYSIHDLVDNKNEYGSNLHIYMDNDSNDSKTNITTHPLFGMICSDRTSEQYLWPQCDFGMSCNSLGFKCEAAFKIQKYLNAVNASCPAPLKWSRTLERCVSCLYSRLFPKSIRSKLKISMHGKNIVSYEKRYPPHNSMVSYECDDGGNITMPMALPILEKIWKSPRSVLLLVILIVSIYTLKLFVKTIVVWVNYDQEGNMDIDSNKSIECI